MNSNVQRVIATAVAAALAAATQAARPTRISAQQPAPVADLVAVCGQRAQWNTDLLNLNADRDRLRTILDNYGFQKTAADFEYYEEFARKANERRNPRQKDPVEKIKDDLQKEVVKKAKSTVEEFIKGLQSARSYNELGPQLETLDKIVRDIGLPNNLRYQITQIAYSADAQRRLSYYSSILKHMDKVETAFEMVESDNELEILKKGVIEAAGEIHPAYGLLAKEIDWAATNLYDATTGRWAKHQIEKLTAMTEGDLQLLKKTTADLNATTRKIADIRKSLAAAPPCDSTQLARQANNKTPKKGMSKGKIVGTAAGAAAAGIGTYVALDYADKALQESRSSSSSSSSSSPSGGGTPPSSASAFNGTYTASATRSCSPGGASNPCANAIPQGGCSYTSFTFTVTNSVVQDACRALISASVSSSGAFTGRYEGTLASIPVTGTVRTSGTFTLSGSAPASGNTYSVTIQVTKR